MFPPPFSKVTYIKRINTQVKVSLGFSIMVEIKLLSPLVWDEMLSPFLGGELKHQLLRDLK